MVVTDRVGVKGHQSNINLAAKTAGDIFLVIPDYKSAMATLGELPCHQTCQFLNETIHQTLEAGVVRSHHIVGPCAQHSQYQSTT